MAKGIMSREGSSPLLSHDQVKELLELVSARGIEEMEIETGDYRLHIVGRRTPQQVVTSHAAHSMVPAPVAAAPLSVAPATVGDAPAAPKGDVDDPKWKKITAPMVGTFYAAPAPDAPNFARVGDRVDDDSVLCIIEAMKLMNEIKAEMRGIVRKVYIENGQPVEYGQPMFAIEPA